MRLGILGNCQVLGLSAAIGALAPALERVTVCVNELEEPAAQAAHADALAGCDLVLAHPLPLPALGPLQDSALHPRLRRLALVPPVVFTGNQPDCIYLLDAAGAAVPSPAIAYHSAIAAAGALEGLAAPRILALFNAHTYARLGYFDAFAQDAAANGPVWASMGLDFGALLAEAGPWLMHTVNHPRIPALMALARQALRRAGIPFAEAPAPADVLADGVRWPVMPEIARRLGLPAGEEALRVHGEAVPMARMVEHALATLPGLALGPPAPQLLRARAFIRARVLGAPAPEAPPRLTVADIQLAYRLVLGRTCESEEMAMAYVEHCPTLEDVRRELLRSAEFAAQYAALQSAN